jgi:hypothetical protein
LGIGRQHTYERAHTGEICTIKIGHVFGVPTAWLRKVLRIEGELKTTEAARANRHDTEAGILLNEPLSKMGQPCSRTLAGLAPRASSKEIDGDVSIGPLPRLDQGPQSRQHRGAAGAERDLAKVIRVCSQEREPGT